MTNEKSNYWLDIAAEDIIKLYPEGEVVVSSGISPSASYHIGHFREVITADALAWAVRRRGRKVRHLHVVDNFDPLRKWYDFLPPTDEDYAGQPISLIPDPIGDCHGSYADHFYEEFRQQLNPMGVGEEGFDIVRSYEDLYLTDKMTPYIDKALEKIDIIKEIFERKSNRKLDDSWTPVSVLGKNNQFVRGNLSTWDKQAQTLNGITYAGGNGKLDWRLDWPARWALLGVNVESFGMQEHGAAGSSYDTGAEFAEKVFGVKAPYGKVQYGHIHRPGETIKMSSSKNNVVTPAQALKIMPAEILRYFIVRGRPQNKIFFDSGEGLYNLIDEFALVQSDPEHTFRDAYNFATAGQTDRIISSVPFKHLVSVYQAAKCDEGEALKILARTGYEDSAKNEAAIIKKELKFVANWLNDYAPEGIKFKVQDKLSNLSLSSEQKAALIALSNSIESEKTEINGFRMHELIYAIKDKTNIKPAELFRAIYKVILGQDSGPKAGWFLANLDKDWLVKRLRLEA